MTRSTTFGVRRMDCPSDESLIRLALQARPEIRELRFDLVQRKLVVIHDGSAQAVLLLLEPLGLDATIETTQTTHFVAEREEDTSR